MAYITKEILGQQVRIDVDTDDGMFRYYGADDHSDRDFSLTNLCKRVRQHLAKRKIKVKVSVGIIQNGRGQNVTLTHINDTDRRTVQARDCMNERVEVSTSNTVYEPWTPETMAELERLRVEYVRASDAFETFKKAHIYLKPTKIGGYVDTTAKAVLQAALDAKAAQTPTLTVTPVAQAAIDAIAADLAKQRDAERDEE